MAVKLTTGQRAWCYVVFIPLVVLSVCFVFQDAIDDPDLAFPFAYVSASVGNAEHQLRLADIYERSKQHDKSLHWYKKAFHKGSPQACVRLGDLLLAGGVEALETDAQTFQAYKCAMLRERMASHKPFCRYASFSAEHTVPDIDKARVICSDQFAPLVLDIDGGGVLIKGKLDRRGQVYFNLVGNDFAIATDWPGSGEGFLVHDKNGDGKITDATEMFAGRIGDAPNGFIALAAYDSNKDLQITPEDEQWPALRVWIDEDRSGDTQDTELHTLDQLGITAINLAYENVDLKAAGGHIWQVSTFVKDGETAEIVAVRFGAKASNSTYQKPVDVTAEIIRALPNMRGYGLLPDLHDAAAEDNDWSNPESLVSLLSDFQKHSLEDIFLPKTNLEEQVLAIMFRWARVDGIDPTSRGRNIDARALEFLNKMTGRRFLQRGVTFDPRPHAAQDLKEGFEMAYMSFSGQLIAQTQAKRIFSGEAFYNARLGKTSGVWGLDQAALAELVNIAKNLQNIAEREQFWLRVAAVVQDAFPNKISHIGVYMALAEAMKESDSKLNSNGIPYTRQKYVDLPLIDPRKQAAQQ